MMRITILGSGANGGIPQINCRCRVCQIARRSPIESRTRSSILVKIAHTGHLLFDATPDLRLQLIRNNIISEDISYIFITHSHFDHVLGLFEFLADTRDENMRITICSDSDVLAKCQEIYGINLEEKFNLLERSDILVSPSLRVRWFEVPHTSPKFGPTIGFSLQYNKTTLIYIPDIARYTEDVINRLYGCDIAILDGTFFERSRFNHASILEAIEVINRMEDGKPKKVFNLLPSKGNSYRGISAKEKFCCYSRRS